MAFLVFLLLVVLAVMMVLRAVGSTSRGPARNPRERRRGHDDSVPYTHSDTTRDDDDRSGGSWLSDMFGGSGDGGSDSSGGDSGGGDGGGGD